MMPTRSCLFETLMIRWCLNSTENQITKQSYAQNVTHQPLVTENSAKRLRDNDDVRHSGSAHIMLSSREILNSTTFALTRWLVYGYTDPY